MQSQACGACRHQRKKCAATCPLAPYFPPDDPETWKMVQDTFGAANVRMGLARLKPSQRADFTKSLIFESEARSIDPVYGTLRIISKCHSRMSALKRENRALKLRLKLRSEAHAADEEEEEKAGGPESEAEEKAPSSPEENTEEIPQHLQQHLLKPAQALQPGHTLQLSLFSEGYQLPQSYQVPQSYQIPQAFHPSILEDQSPFSEQPSEASEQPSELPAEPSEPSEPISEPSEASEPISEPSEPISDPTEPISEAAHYLEKFPAAQEAVAAEAASTESAFMLQDLCFPEEDLRQSISFLGEDTLLPSWGESCFDQLPSFDDSKIMQGFFMEEPTCL